MKAKIAMFVALLLVMVFPCVANADSLQPVYLENGNAAFGSQYPVFYANGTPITIDTDGTDTIISYEYNGQSNSVKVSKRTTVFGGGVAGTSFESSSITMKGGTLASIVGGGEGTIIENAAVKKVDILISGGKISKILKDEGASKKEWVKGTVSGGGLLNSIVEEVNIEVTGGTISSIMGGGIASTIYNDVRVNVGNKVNPEDSTNITGEVRITISGGTIYSEEVKYGLVYGGGQGYSYVGGTNVTIKGEADLSNAWLVSGGSNGRTDDAVININGGTIKVVQTINRGSMINSRINMDAGQVTTMYVGGEDPESFDNDIVNGGFLGNIILDIEGGTITNLKLGSNYNKTIEKDASYVKVFYDVDSVLNSSELPTTMGSIAIPYAEESSVVERKATDIIITTDMLEAIKATNNTYTISVDQKYDWVFKSVDIVDSTIPVTTEITVTEEAPTDIKDGVDNQVADLELEDVLFINFAHEGDLPGKATVIFDVAGTYEDGTVLYVLHFNESTNKLENQQEVTVTDGKLAIVVETCSTYVVSSTRANITSSSVENPNTGDINVVFLAMMIFVGAGSLAFVTKKSYNLLKKTQ